MRTHSQLAYILHKRAFRDSSQILEVFTRDHGRLALMSRGSRGARSRQSGILQLYRPLLVGWSGRGEIPQLTSAEAAELKAPGLRGDGLLSAMYINELMMYLTHRHDSNENLFQVYHDCLYALQQQPVEPVLRLFEKALLECLGFGLNLLSDADSGEPVDAGGDYVYHAEHGPVAIGLAADSPRQLPRIAGSSLIAYARGQLDTPEILKEIKSLNRYVLAVHLAGRKLRSRELFRRKRVR